MFIHIIGKIFIICLINVKNQIFMHMLKLSYFTMHLLLIPKPVTIVSNLHRGLPLAGD